MSRVRVALGPGREPAGTLTWLPRCVHEAQRLPGRAVVSIKQLYCTPEETEKLVDDIDAEIFTSQWIPLDTIRIDRDQWPGELDRLEGIWSTFLGKQSRKLVPHFIQYSVDRCAGYTRPTARHVNDRACLQISGVFIHIGRPAICTDRFDRPDVNTVVLAPHIRRNYPAGFWVLERGEKHPSVAAFADLSAWVESDDGRPVQILYGRGYHHRECIELFPTRAAADDSIRSQKEELPELDVPSEPLELRGRALLEAISHTEALIGVNTVAETDDDDDAELLFTSLVEAEELAARLRAWKSET